MKPIEMAPKPSSDSKQRYQSTIETSVKASDLVDRALDSKITISACELFATSVDTRKHVKELLTSKKVAANSVEEERTNSYLPEYLNALEDSSNIDFEKYKQLSSSAQASLPLRVIYPMFGSDVQAEAILDSGAQIVTMQ